MINYFKNNFLYDLKAGFITAIVALPLALAFAIASGVEPIFGLYTAIIAGILGSLFGGSKFSITGPTGAMAVIILSTINQYGLEGLLLAGFLAGLIQILLGLLKVGKVIKFIPISVVVGFTAGIGVIIFIGQIGNFFGLIIPSKEHVWETIIEIFKNIFSLNIFAVGIAIFTIIFLIYGQKLLSKNNILKNIPASIIALIISAVSVAWLSLNIPVVGLIPKSLPTINLFLINLELIKNVLPAALSIALLGSIEALLCAVVCDAMTSTKHNSNKELISQGVSNVVLPFFGGIPCTAAIARSAVNIREGAKTKFAGVIHAVFILCTVLFFAPFAQYIPKAFLAGILIVVSVKMINFEEVKLIWRTGISERLIFLVTLISTILFDLVFAVQMGMILAIFLIFIRILNTFEIKNIEEYDSNGDINLMVKKRKSLNDKVAIYTFNGPFFFGALNIFEEKINEHIHSEREIIILRMKHVPFIDGSAMIQLLKFLEVRKKSGGTVLFTELKPDVKKSLNHNEDFKLLVKDSDFFKTVEDALNFAEKIIENK